MSIRWALESPSASVEPIPRQSLKAIHALIGLHNGIILGINQNEMMAQAIFLSVKPLLKVRQPPQAHLHFGKALLCDLGPWRWGRGEPETTSSSLDREKCFRGWGVLKKVPERKPNGHQWASFPILPPAHC